MKQGKGKGEAFEKKVMYRRQLERKERRGNWGKGGEDDT